MNVQVPKPGEGKAAEPRGRRPRRTPKGRQIDPGALAEIEALLGDRPRQRDLLIEFLHLIQDRYGYISAAHLAALAHEMKLAQAEVYEVATFYAHFDVVKEGEAPPPPVTVRVCELAVLRDGGRRASAARSARRPGRRRPRDASALHGRLRPCAGLRRRPRSGVRRNTAEDDRGGWPPAHMHTPTTRPPISPRIAPQGVIGCSPNASTASVRATTSSRR